MKRLLTKRVLCILSVAALTLAAGCGNRNNGTADGSPGNSQGDTQQSSVGDHDTAMGRYAEEEIDLTKELEIVSGMKKLPDESLVITDTSSGIWESKDMGATWENINSPWLDEMFEHTYFLDIQSAADGTLGIIYHDYGEEDGDGQEDTETGPESGVPEGEETEEPNAEDTEDRGTDGEETEVEVDKLNEDEEGDESSAFDFHSVCELVKPDGTVVPVELSLSEDEMYPSRIWFSDSGRIFVTTLGDKIYKVHEDGSSEQLLTVDGRPQLLQFMGNLLIVDGYDFTAPLLYDLEKGEIVEAEELSAFIAENYQDRDFNGGSWYDLYLFPGGESELYLAGEKGLHCYHMEDGSVEQLIDGKLSRLGSPLYSLKSMVVLGEEEFLSVSGAGKLIRFTYDPNMPSSPSESLSVYSLEDNYSLRTAISLYQINHPEVYVDYEIGMAEGEAVTRDDALKKLNTQIMSGEGPDLLLMDGLPMDSYMEKGLLRDLTDLMVSIGKEEDLYENLYQNMAKDGKVTIVPTEVYLPVILGRESYVSRMTDLESIADGICRLREDNPEKDIIYLCDEKAIMKAFAPIAAPLWKNDGGEIDREAIAQFLTQMKRIYDAQMDGLNEKSLEEHRMIDEYSAEEYGEDWMYDITQYSNNELYFVGDYLQLSMGITTYPYGYWTLTSVAKNKGSEDAMIVPAKGMCENVYIPATMLGINAASAKTERAEEFLKEFLGKEIQTALGSYVINKEALEESFRPEEGYVGENGEYGMMAILDEDGRETDLSVYLATEEEMDTFRNWMESADTPYIADMVLEKAVFEAGEKYIQGEQSLEETLEAIEQQLAIYLSE